METRYNWTSGVDFVAETTLILVFLHVIKLYFSLSPVLFIVIIDSVEELFLLLTVLSLFQ